MSRNMVNSTLKPSRWLGAARLALLGWILLVILTTLLSIPAKYQSLRSLEPGTGSLTAFYGWSAGQTQAVVQALGLRPEWIAWVRLSAGLVCLLCFWVAGSVLFWRRSDTWAGLLAAFILFSTGPGFSGLFLNLTQLPAWNRNVGFLQVLFTFPTFFVMLYLFPNGKFTPRFTRTLAVVPYLATMWVGLFPQDNSVWTSILEIATFLYISGGLVSQVYRYRKVSTPEERQQTKWVVFALGITIAGAFFTPSLPIFFPAWVIGTPARFWYELIGNGVVGILMPALIPLALGVSILRYRLWDIDILIRRTLSYALLSALLGLVYFGSVTLLQALVSFAGGQRSAAVTVVSTLAIAALFNPLRKGVQHFIDQRFYRQKYNAELALAEFARAARSEMDLVHLSGHLTHTVQVTLQPEHTNLWLKPALKEASLSATTLNSPQKSERPS